MTDATEELLTEHQQCMGLVGEVEATLRRGRRDAELARALSESLGSLLERLEAHFAREERGHLYTELPIARPRFAQRLDRLRQEHQRMLSAFGETRVTAKRASEPPGAPELPGLFKRLRAALATLHRHEAEENEILLCAHWDDLGGPGD